MHHLDSRTTAHCPRTIWNKTATSRPGNKSFSALAALCAGIRPTTTKIDPPSRVAILLLLRCLLAWFVVSAGRATWMRWGCCDRPRLSAASPPRTSPTRHRGLHSAITLDGRRLHLPTALGWWRRLPLAHFSADLSRTRTMAGMTLGILHLWGSSLCGRAPAGMIGRSECPFQQRPYVVTSLASLCAVTLLSGTLCAVLGPPLAGASGERTRGAWLHRVCAGSRIDQQQHPDISVLSVHPNRVLGFLLVFFLIIAAGLSGALGRLSVSGSSVLWSGSASCRTVLAVAGKDYCVVASDTRLGLGYSIPSRKVSRILKMYVLPSHWSWPFCGGSYCMALCSAPTCACCLGLEAHRAIYALCLAFPS